ncbi:MAG TPA: alpha/beta hydrolase [Chloroflexota bacterium]|nr:alpha/beta hydrolase [Chloroflexota bacterium]
MNTVTSRDGTTIAFEKTGRGPAVVLVGGLLGDRSQQAPLAALLADRFTVFNYDRRGHGESGNTGPYAVEREIEDLGAILDRAGEPAFVYGTSGCAVLALYAAAAGLAPRIRKLALWEPPYVLDDRRPPVPPDYRERLSALLAQGRRGDMIELFMTEAVGLPREFVAPMRQAPFWPAQEALAHTLVYDAAIMDDFSLPRERIATVTVPTLVLDGGTTPWLSHAAQAVAEALPNARRRTLAGQPHNVAPEALAPALVECFAG